MWQPDGGLIQIEVGAEIIKVFTAPDDRGLFGRWFDDPPEEGQLLIEATQLLREHLQQEEGLSLPQISYRDDTQLEDNEVRIYFGLEIQQFKINYKDEFHKFIVHKIREYNEVLINQESVTQLLLTGLEDVTQDNYQRAFKKYSIVYYHSLLQRYEIELIQSLSDSGGILLKSGDLKRALPLFVKAASLCNNPSIVDPIIKLQVHLNKAEALKALQILDEALCAYIIAANIALYSENYSHLFLALINIAQIQYLTENYEQSIFTLEQADELILQEEKPDFYISRNIQKSLSGIKDILLQKQTQEIQTLEN
jgi:tetratricopeptide (TPR) repeat protein